MPEDASDQSTPALYRPQSCIDASVVLTPALRRHGRYDDTVATTISVAGDARGHGANESTWAGNSQYALPARLISDRFPNSCSVRAPVHRFDTPKMRARISSSSW